MQVLHACCLHYSLLALHFAACITTHKKVPGGMYVPDGFNAVNIPHESSRIVVCMYRGVDAGRE